MSASAPHSFSREFPARFSIPALLAIVAIAYVRLRLMGTPLERDEGEYGYIGQLMLRGLSPFAEAYTMKLPGTSAIYALFMSVLGQTVEAVRLALMCAVATSAILVHRLARRMYGPEAALAAAAIYVILSASRSVLGLFAHATQFAIPFLLGGFLLLDRFRVNRRPAECLLGGFCLGLAVLMKQHAAILVAYAAVRVTLWKPPAEVSTAQRFRSCAYLIAGATLPYTALCAWVAASGSFPAFWFWTVRYAAEYAAALPLSDGWEIFLNQGMSLFYWQFPLWSLAAAGFASATREGGEAGNSSTASPIPLLSASFLAVCPGLYFRPHYFVLMIPAASLLGGRAVARLDRYFLGRTPPSVTPARRALRVLAAPLLFTALIGLALQQERGCFFDLSPREVSREIYGENPFPESAEIARYIREHSAPDDRIAIFGSEPQILFYAQRLSATGNIYTYGLMENHPFAREMQRRMIREIEASRPLFFVTVNFPLSWIEVPRSDQTLFKWVDPFLDRNYIRVGIAELNPGEETRYYWDREAGIRLPSSEFSVMVFRRNAATFSLWKPIPVNSLIGTAGPPYGSNSPPRRRTS